jgi:hypothetical protein
MTAQFQFQFNSQDLFILLVIMLACAAVYLYLQKSFVTSDVAESSTLQTNERVTSPNATERFHGFDCGIQKTTV